MVVGPGRIDRGASTVEQSEAAIRRVVASDLAENDSKVLQVEMKRVDNDGEGCTMCNLNMGDNSHDAKSA